MRMTRFISTLAVLAYLAGSAAAFAQKKAKPAAKPAAPKPGVKARPGQGTLKNAAGVKGKEEQEISAPKPTSAKLPEVKYENEDMSKNPTRGTFTFTMSGGLYNFNNKTTNPQTNTSREYSLPFDYTTMVGYELAFRLGKDKENDDDSKTGFHYYRSNRGIFTDFELGVKTQRYEDKPSRFTYKETSAAGTSEVPVDLGYDYTSALFLANNTTGAQNLRKAGISPELRSSVGNKSVEVTMVYANTYYHFTPLNYIMNFGSAFRWFDASIGPSFRVWYYQDYSDPVRLTTRNDDWTRATLMAVYRQYIQFHPMVRLRTHFYFPALSYFAELAKSPRFNENEIILNTALEFYVKRFGDFGVIVGVGYEGHWWKANKYSSDRFVRTGFLGDNGFTDQQFSGFEHSTRTSWEAFATLGIEIHFGGDK
jgi:hypothetical protein